MDIKAIRNTLMLVGAAASAALLARHLYRRPLPQVSGSLKAAGLRAPVNVIRDHWGVPHIYAENLHDLFFAQGYVHAQDRLWQMEFNRRIGRGRLAEIFGPVALETDILLRTIGLGRAAKNDLEHTDREALEFLSVYSLGVNTFIGENHDRLPLEFTILGLKPEPWTPLDTLAWGKMLAWGLSGNWDSEILHAAFIQRLGSARAARLQGEYPDQNPLVMADHTFASMLEQLVAHFDAAQEWLPGGGISGMSNNWAVDGIKSTTGKPLLANDPHLNMQMPSIWMENHLVSPALQASGVTLQGVPGVVIGHNQDIAWGMTASFADVQDIYIEKLNPDDPREYEFQGQWEKAQIIHEEIEVKGQAPHAIEVNLTRHGPIINSLAAGLRADATTRLPEALSLRWVGYEVSHASRSIFNLNRARDWDEFTHALRDYDLPSLNFAYADREGNIGMYMSGKIPIRARGNGSVPVPGWTGEYEWIDWIPHDQLPHSFNPPEHFVASANNLVVGKEYSYLLTTETMNGYRARRIVEMLRAKEKLSAEDFGEIQVDLYCRPAEDFCYLLREWAPALLAHPAITSVREQAAEVLDLIRGWDHILDADSVPGAIYKLTQYFAMRRVFEPWFGPLTEHYLGNGLAPVVAEHAIYYIDHTPLVLHRILLNDEREWMLDAAGQPITRVDVLAGALKDAIMYLRETIGEDPFEWTWGRVHQLTFAHPLGAVKPLDRIFNRGPFPFGGDGNTVWQAVYNPRLPIDPATASSASWRQILDLSDWDASLVTNTTGQSGHPASPHYADQLPSWFRGDYHQMLWTRERVEAEAEATLELLP